ncbi:MAG: DUF234 domain-containing protein [Clostridiales bacterium]|nr:DUF234 domain-containing protein [Clostridiales bacterium]
MAETEIDILAINREADRYLVGECKFKSHPFRYSEYLDVKAKLSPLTDKAKLYYALFSESGFDEKIQAEVADEELLLFSLEKIVNCEI